MVLFRLLQLQELFQEILANWDYYDYWNEENHDAACDLEFCFGGVIGVISIWECLIRRSMLSASKNNIIKLSYTFS